VKRIIANADNLWPGFKCKMWEMTTIRETRFTQSVNCSRNTNRSQWFTMSKWIIANADNLWPGFKCKTWEMTTIRERRFTQSLNCSRNTNRCQWNTISKRLFLNNRNLTTYLKYHETGLELKNTKAEVEKLFAILQQRERNLDKTSKTSWIYWFALPKLSHPGK
jgi:hypothetical protein